MYKLHLNLLYSKKRNIRFDLLLIWQFEICRKLSVKIILPKFSLEFPFGSAAVLFLSWTDFTNARAYIFEIPKSQA